MNDRFNSGKTGRRLVGIGCDILLMFWKLFVVALIMFIFIDGGTRLGEGEEEGLFRIYLSIIIFVLFFISNPGRIYSVSLLEGYRSEGSR